MKRLISIFMSAAIAFTSIVSSFPAYAEESAPQLTEQVQNTPKASGTGTVGTMLSEEINEELTEQQGNQGFNVFAAEVEENVVTITFEALEDCTLVTAILDDAGEVLLYTESVDVLAGQTEAELTIAAEEMPQYFTLHAYLIDSDTFRPLCAVYECYTYTQEMQEFLAKTIEDFDQELVVSFDGSTDTNSGETLVHGVDYTYSSATGILTVLTDKAITIANANGAWSGYSVTVTATPEA